MKTYPASNTDAHNNTVLRFVVYGVIAFVALLGWYYIHANNEMDRRDRAYQEASNRQTVDQWRATVEQAVRDGKVIRYMTRSDVINSWGTPEEVLDGAHISQPVRQGGGVEVWQWDRYGKIIWVVFGSDGHVLASSDMVKKD